jgi:hypothetical protein
VVVRKRQLHFNTSLTLSACRVRGAGIGVGWGVGWTGAVGGDGGEIVWVTWPLA